MRRNWASSVGPFGQLFGARPNFQKQNPRDPDHRRQRGRHGVRQPPHRIPSRRPSPQRGTPPPSLRPLPRSLCFSSPQSNFPFCSQMRHIRGEVGVVANADGWVYLSILGVSLSDWMCGREGLILFLVLMAAPRCSKWETPRSSLLSTAPERFECGS